MREGCVQKHCVLPRTPHHLSCDALLAVFLCFFTSSALDAYSIGASSSIFKRFTSATALFWRLNPRARLQDCFRTCTAGGWFVDHSSRKRGLPVPKSGPLWSLYASIAFRISAICGRFSHSSSCSSAIFLRRPSLIISSSVIL